jgi:hypothetical protein
MKFVKIDSIFQKQRLWRAVEAPFTFVVSKEVEEDFFRASAKAIAAKPFDGSRMDIGQEHKTFDDAKKACEQFYTQRTT